MRPRALTGGPPPRVLVLTAAAVLTVATVLAVLGATRTGITTDEPIHVMRLRNYLETGWFALDWDYEGEGPGSEGTNTFVYAPVTMLLLHVWSVLWGVEGWGEVSASAHAYDVRHLGVVVISLVGLAAVAALGRVILRHWRWGLVAAAVLAAMPIWTGHAMYNVKDVAVATGYTVATLGLVLFVRAEPPRLRVRLGRAACLAGGLVLALGTRPGMWPGLLAVLTLALVGVVLTAATRRAGLTALAEGAAACAVAAAALVAVYPRLFGSPLRALPGTSEASSSFLGGAKSDRMYVPRHLMQDLPTLLLLFVVTGAVVGVVLLVRRGRADRVLAMRVALVGVQASALPVVAILMASDLYHGLRQLLFALPALALLAACGMAWWIEWAGPARARPLLGSVVVATTSVALVLPTVDQVTLQPYQATYVNLATDVLSRDETTAASRRGDDYWRVSVGELVEGAPLDRQLVCKATTSPDTGIAYPFANAAEAFSTSRSLDCREEATGPLAPAGLSVVRPPAVEEFDAVFIGSLPPNCRSLHEVSRWRHGFEVVLTTLARCTMEPAPLPVAGARVGDPALGTTQAGDLWLYATDGWLQWPGRPELTSPVSRAELAFRAVGPCTRRDCTLVVHGRAPEDVVVTLDGEEVPARRHIDGSLRVPIPRHGRTDDVWLTLTRRSGEPLGTSLTGLSLTPRQANDPTRGQA